MVAQDGGETIDFTFRRLSPRVVTNDRSGLLSRGSLDTRRFSLLSFLSPSRPTRCLDFATTLPPGPNFHHGKHNVLPPVGSHPAWWTRRRADLAEAVRGPAPAGTSIAPAAPHGAGVGRVPHGRGAHARQ